SIDAWSAVFSSALSARSASRSRSPSSIWLKLCASCPRSSAVMSGVTARVPLWFAGQVKVGRLERPVGSAHAERHQSPPLLVAGMERRVGHPERLVHVLGEVCPESLAGEPLDNQP